MGYNLSNSLRDYTDIVVYDLLHFINRSMDSTENKERSGSDLSYPRSTSFFELYDEDQVMHFYCDEYEKYLFLLDNNKFLIVSWSQEEWVTFFIFDLYSDANKTIMKIENNLSGKKTITFDNGKEPVIFKEADIYRGYRFPKQASLTEFLRPISLDQLYERGMRNPQIEIQKTKR